MDTLHVSLFGQFDVRYGEQVLIDLNVRKVQELLCYLLIFRDHSHHRETLASLLWSENCTSHSKSYLRKTLWQLQSVLEFQCDHLAGNLLLVEPEWITINPEAHLFLDVAEFEGAFTLVQGVPGKELDTRRAQILQNAVNLYRGDLLEGWYHDWCIYERERLQHIYLVILDKLMGHCETQREFEKGLVYGGIILRHDKARERTHRRLMRLHNLAGDRTSALRQYARCVTALEKELGVKPARRTEALYNQIRLDQLRDTTMEQTDSFESPSIATSTLTEVLGRLKHLHVRLVDLQDQVSHDIQIVNSILNNHH